MGVWWALWQCLGLRGCAWSNWSTFAAAGTAALAESSQALRSDLGGQVSSTDLAAMISLPSTVAPHTFSFAFVLLLQSLLEKTCPWGKTSVGA